MLLIIVTPVRLIAYVIHAVDEGNAVTLVFEDWVGEGPPTTILTLIQVGWPLRRNLKSYGFGTDSNGYRGDYHIGGRIDH